MILRGIDPFEALSNVYKLILRLSMKFSVSHRGKVHRVELPINIAVAVDWARETLYKVLPHSLML